MTVVGIAEELGAALGEVAELLLAALTHVHLVVLGVERGPLLTLVEVVFNTEIL